jgi:hypothetical protein
MMKDTINYSQVPDGFLLCLNTKCLRANNCLRQMAGEIVPAEEERIKIVNPKYIATLSDDCAYYYSSEKVRYARGFIKLLGNLPYRKMRAVIRQLIISFGQTTYYRIRKGERLLSPAEQQEILNIIKSSGIDQPQEFDAYIEGYHWEPLLL